MKLTAKQIEQFKQCASPEEVLEKAKELGLQMTLAEAKEAINVSGIAELDKEDLEQVAGGLFSCPDDPNDTPKYDGVPCKWCDQTNTVCKQILDGYIRCYCNDCEDYFVRYKEEQQ